MEVAEDMEKGSRTLTRHRSRCYVCSNCKKPNCEECKHCVKMFEFGRLGRAKQACLDRRCEKLQEEDNLEETYEKEDDTEQYNQEDKD